VLNDPSKDIEHKTPNRIFQEKTLYFIVNEKNPKLISDSMIHHFIKNDEFIQNEIYNVYNKLRIVFYKRSERTDQMLKQKSSVFLPYCNEDILYEYGWENGKPSDTLYFENGVIKGSENIHLNTLDSIKKNK
jgi:hypothetical protein